MSARARRPGKRRRYTRAERTEILRSASKVGPVEAARRHEVPQTTVSNWLHRDAAKAEEVAKKIAAAKTTGRPEKSKRARKRAGGRSEAATGLFAAETKVAKPTTILPKPGTPLPSSLVTRVARSYTPSAKAEALEYAARHGVSAAADKFTISRFSIYDWKRKVEKAAAGEGPSPTSGPSPQTIEEQRDQEILGEWRKHPGLGPSQIRNQLRRRGVKVSVTTARRVMEDAGYRPPKVKREPHDERFEAVRPNHLWHLDFVHRNINRATTFTLILIDD